MLENLPCQERTPLTEQSFFRRTERYSLRISGRGENKSVDLKVIKCVNCRYGPSFPSATLQFGGDEFCWFRVTGLLALCSFPFHLFFVVRVTTSFFPLPAVPSSLFSAFGAQSFCFIGRVKKKLNFLTYGQMS